ncbi:MAG: VanZ family protein [Candidatus Omnitrophota bacterium]
MLFIKYWLPVIICGIIISSVSSIPGSNIPGLFSGQDIIFHGLEFALFGFLLSRAIKKYYPKLIRNKRIVLVFFLVFIYGLLDEFHQIFVPNRHMDMSDVIIDSIGGLIGGLLYR